MVNNNKRVVKLNAYCKFRERDVVENEVNKDCPCFSCSILKQCLIHTCEHQAMVFVFPDEYRNKMEQCAKCAILTQKHKERVKERTR